MACTQQHDIPDFDEAAWRDDPNGCEGVRMDLAQALQQNIDRLKGLTQDQTIELLGKPDQNELYKRNQKFFIYNMNCVASDSTKLPVYLSIRFNATGLAKEVMIYD